MHQRIAAAYGVGDNLLPADAGLLMRLGHSPEYNTIRDRITGPWPLDSWQEDGFHYFVLELQPAGDPGSAGQEPPTAVFTMHPESDQPIAAVVVTPSATSEQAEIIDLREPGQAYTAPIPSAA
jgi:hypothetical protein